jgi:hypothetical protein
MRETRSSGSVRGASGDGRPYRERILPVPERPGQGRLTEPAADTRPWRWALLLVPLSGPCRRTSSAVSGGSRPFPICPACDAPASKPARSPARIADHPAFSKRRFRIERIRPTMSRPRAMSDNLDDGDRK